MNLPPFLEKIAREREGKVEVKGEVKMLLKLVARNSLVLTDERARITAYTDLATLDRWFDNAFTAKTAAELFA